MSTKVNTQDYESALAEIWRHAVDPKGVGMPEALAEDIGSYTGEPVDLVLRRMQNGKDDFARQWTAAGTNPADSASVVAFYRNHFVEAYELAEWHSGRLNGFVPLNYAHAATLAREKHLRRALDFGSGIGTGSLCLHQAGCQVDCADVSNTLLAFVAHRFAQRGSSVTTFDLADGQNPPRRTYDLITCFDVLEHVPDQLKELRRIESLLRPGGYLLVNFMVDSYHPDRPMHISSAGNWLAMVRQTSLVPDWDWCRYSRDWAQAFVLRRYGRARNFAAQFIDRRQASAAASSH